MWDHPKLVLLLICVSIYHNVVVEMALTDPSNVAVGDEICFEGFVMDNYCISLGTLVDNPNVVTLERPEVHSVHCLVDLEACATSNYELLSEPTVKGGIYTRAFQFVNASKVLLQEVARASGSVSASPACTSCVGNGTLVRGLRAEIRGTVSVLGDNKIPPTVELTSAIHSNGQAIVCENAKSRAFDLMESNSGGSGTLADPTAVMLGEEVCFEGFVMDNFCIERGTLLDKPEVVTLLGPERHSAHCLVEFPACTESPYELLREPDQRGDKYSRAFQVDDPGREMLRDLAIDRSNDPTCGICNGNGDVRRGFRAQVRGEVIALANGNTPAILRVMEAIHSNGMQSVCDGAQSRAFDLAAGTSDETSKSISISLSSTQIMKIFGSIAVVAMVAAILLTMSGVKWFQSYRTDNADQSIRIKEETTALDP